MNRLQAMETLIKAQGLVEENKLSDLADLFDIDLDLYEGYHISDVFETIKTRMQELMEMVGI